eukprot:scaffold2520_cov324-Prasinococcus_capsulatus_cf.AAC.8
MLSSRKVPLRRCGGVAWARGKRRSGLQAGEGRGGDALAAQTPGWMRPVTGVGRGAARRGA